MADWTLGGGYEYSDILLRDKDGNPITHEDITRFDLDMADGRVQPYHDLSALNSYFLASSGDDYIVTGKNPPGFSFAGGFYGLLQRIYEGIVNEYGSVVGSGDNARMQVMILYTLKNLEVGQTYSYDYLMNQGGE